MPLGLSWHDYNESLVERGRIILDLGRLPDSREAELRSMNNDKLGRPFEFTDSYIQFLAFIKTGFDAPYRIVQGVLRALSEYIRFVEEMHFTHIRRRMLKLLKGKKPSEIVSMDTGDEGKEPITVVVDSTGLSTTTKGSYIEERWRKEKRRFLKLHILADKESKKIVGFRVTSERTGDSKKFKPLVKEASKKRRIVKAYADAAYDSRSNFNLLDEKGIDPAIKLRRNARTRSLGSPLRRREAALLKKLGYGGWKNLKDYGERWIAEIVFSAFKRTLGDSVSSRRFDAQRVEASFKVMLYNKFLSL